MIRSTLSRRLIRKRPLVATAQHTPLYFFTNESISRTQVEENEASTGSDDNSIKQHQDEKRRNFVPFFQEVDQISKDDLNFFFQSLGGMPRDVKKNMAPTLPPPSLSASSDSTSTTPPPERLSIFDAFPIPDTPLVEEELPENAYDVNAFGEFSELVEEVFGESKFRREHTKKPLSDTFLEPIKQWLQTPYPTVEYKLPILQKSVLEGLQSKEAFRQEMEEQREEFLTQVPLSKQQYKKAALALKLVGNACAKHAKSSPLLVAWEKIKESGMHVDKDSLNSMLYSCIAFGSGSSNNDAKSYYLAGDSVLDMLSSATSKTTVEEKDDDDDDDEYEVNLPEEVATFHDLLYDPTEESVTIRIRSLVAKGNASAAEALLDQFSVCNHVRVSFYCFLSFLKRDCTSFVIKARRSETADISTNITMLPGTRGHEFWIETL